MTKSNILERLPEKKLERIPKGGLHAPALAPIRLLGAPDAPPLELMGSLSETQKTRLEQCENIIRKGLLTSIEVGNALLTIREERLFRSTHDSFQSYCHERWGIGRSYASRVIGAAERLRLLPGDDSQPKPVNEFQVRPFLRLQPAQFPGAWQEVVKRAKDGPVTPTLVREVIEERLSKGNRSLARRKAKRRTTTTGCAPLGQILALLQEAKQGVEKMNAAQALAALERIEILLFEPEVLAHIQTTDSSA